ncbi:hypothetical protein [Spongiimicrobium sp. 2-473A-2-J]|uniref:hypothetical protein n=1 Tax=Eudoraea algarum TaxID=3417568 RepID=UPI003D3690D9
MKVLLTLVMVLAILGGLYLAYSIFSNKKPPLSAANIHGVIGLLVLGLLGYNAYSLKLSQLWIALGLLLMAAFGGLYLVNNHKKGQLGPKSAIIIHAIVGLSGIGLTLISIW